MRISIVLVMALSLGCGGNRNEPREPDRSAEIAAATELTFEPAGPPRPPLPEPSRIIERETDLPTGLRYDRSASVPRAAEGYPTTEDPHAVVAPPNAAVDRVDSDRELAVSGQGSLPPRRRGLKGSRSTAVEPSLQARFKR